MNKNKTYCIAFVLVSMESGGTENYLLRFLNFLKEEDNVEVTIICKGGQTGSLEEEFKQHGVQIEILKLGYTDLKSILNFKNLLNKNYDVVCDLTGNFAGISMLLARINKVPKRIAFYRASSDHFNPTFFNSTYNNLMKWLVRKYATSILSNSTAAFNYFHHTLYKKDKRFKVIKNGVYVDVFSNPLDKTALRRKYGLPLDVVLVGHVGRLNAAKNFETIFKVAHTLKNETINGKKIKFVFCGRETDSKKFKEKLVQHEIEESCICLGQQSKVNEILHCYDLFYFPSVTEGQPNALIEALISGLPFVASNIEAIKESLPKEAHKCLVNPLDVMWSSNKILETLKNPNPLLLKDWAIAEYDAEKRFKEFKDILLKK